MVSPGVAKHVDIRIGDQDQSRPIRIGGGGRAHWLAATNVPGTSASGGRLGLNLARKLAQIPAHAARKLCPYCARIWISASVVDLPHNLPAARSAFLRTLLHRVVYIDPGCLPPPSSHCSPSLVQAPPFRPKAHNEPEMSFAVDKASTSSDTDPKGQVPSYSLDEKRRAALAEIDNAKFS